MKTDTEHRKPYLVEAFVAGRRFKRRFPSQAEASEYARQIAETHLPHHTSRKPPHIGVTVARNY